MDNVEAFLKSSGVLFDVRSPKEFSHATLAGACNLPLFSDEERACVGTIYKKQGKQAAILQGLQIVAPKMAALGEKALQAGPTRLFCARGGLRSSSVSWLFSLLGNPPITLKGGYKAFRNWVLKKLAVPYRIVVIGGFTGSKKTEILYALQDLGEQIVDLEGLCSHRGSAFGHIDLPAQPTQEAFENKIAEALLLVDPTKPLFIEDESRTIGQCTVPDLFYLQMRKAPFFFIEIPKQERHSNLLASYGNFSADALIQSTLRLAKKLGGVRLKEICERVHAQDLAAAASYLQTYYDNAYKFSLKRKEGIPICLQEEDLSPQQWAVKIQSLSRSSLF